MGLLAFIGIWSTPLRAHSLDPATIALFPRNVANFGYANIEQARGLPWFAQFKQQILPTRFADLENFLRAAGIDSNTQIREVAWAFGSISAKSAAGGSKADAKNDPSVSATEDALPDSHRFVGIALGSFDPESEQARLKSSSIESYKWSEVTVYECESCSGLFVAFIDANTIAFGDRESLAAMLQARAGTADNLQQNSDFMALLDQANDEGIFWGVLGRGAARQTIRRLLPEAANFTQAQALFKAAAGMVITFRKTDAIEANARLIVGSPQDASTMSVLLQAALLLRERQTTERNEPLQKVLDGVKVMPSGNTVDISVAISHEQLITLVQSNTFVL